ASVHLLSRSGFYLVRFCTLPDGLIQDADRAIGILDRTTISSWVARNGRECYISDLKGPKPFSTYLGLQRPSFMTDNILSVFCVPIFVRSRLVGTLCVESEYQGAFHAYRHLIRGIAEQIRLALLRSQGLSEQLVLAAGARMTLNTHELLKCRDEIRQLRELLMLTAPATLHTLDRIEAKLAGCVDGDESDGGSSQEFCRLLDVVTETIEQKGVAPFCVWRSDLSCADSHWISGTTASALRLALGEVLDNSILAAARVAHSELTLH